MHDFDVAGRVALRIRVAGDDVSGAVGVEIDEYWSWQRGRSSRDGELTFDSGGMSFDTEDEAHQSAQRWAAVELRDAR